MVESRRNKTPFPQVGLEGKIDSSIQGPYYLNMSGEITAISGEVPVGATRKAGRVVDVWMSAQESGKDDSIQLAVSGEAYINGVSCLSTVPSIRHISGEASQAKTTKVTGDTGITQAVINESANTFAPGDIISAQLVGVERSPSVTPTTEIHNVVIVIEVEPVSDSPHSF